MLGGGGLPLSFYMRSARLCMKKAALAQAQSNGSEELQHLRRFEALVACALPAHPEYSERRGEKAVRELHVGLVEARRRIQELIEIGERKLSSPKRVNSPKRQTSPRRGNSRPKAPDKRNLRPTKSPRLPPLVQKTQKKSRLTPNRAESPLRNSPKSRRPLSPKSKKRTGSESPKSKKRPNSESPKSPKSKKRSNSESPKSPKNRRQQTGKSPGIKRPELWECKMEGIPSIYFPRKLPTSLQKNKIILESGESQSSTPALTPNLRDSTRSLPAGRAERQGMPDLRKSYDELKRSHGRFKHNISEDYDENEMRTAERYLSKKSPEKSEIISKVEKIWDNAVYEKGRKLEDTSVQHAANDRSYQDDQIPALKGSLSSIKMRVDEEGKKWRSRVNILEKEIDYIKDETEGDLVTLRRSVQEEARKRDEFAARLTASVRKDMDALEVGVAKELDNLKEMISGDRNWMENVIRETVEKCLMGKSDSPLKEELRTLQLEVQSLAKGRDELENHVEQLMKLLENDRDSMSTEQISLKTENGYIRKQLQGIKKDGVKTRMEVVEFKKDCEAEVEELRRMVGQLRDEAVEVKVELEGVKSDVKSEKGDKTPETVIMDRVENLSKLYLGGLDEVRMEILGVNTKCQDQIEHLEDAIRNCKQRQDDSSSSRSSSRGLSLEELNSRVSHLESKQEFMHLAGLEEMRKSIFNVEMKYQGKVENIESQLKDLHKHPGAEIPAVSRASSKDFLLDDLESRVSDLEHKLDRKQEGSTYALEEAVAVIEKERNLATAAAADSAAAASKAADILDEVMASSDGNHRGKSAKLHLRLSAERDAFSAAASDIRRTSIDVTRDCEQALTAACDAKRKAEDLQQHIRNTYAEVAKERDAAALAAKRASAAASEAEDAMTEVTVFRKKMRSDGDGSWGTKLRDLETRLGTVEVTISSKNGVGKVTAAAKTKAQNVRKKTSSADDGRMALFDSRLGNLESHLEHVASATYTNLRILDTKVEHISVSVQSALEGSSLAESKCGVLGSELVKVFRVLASFKKGIHTESKQPYHHHHQQQQQQQQQREQQRERDFRSKESPSPGRRPHFACESCKKAAAILSGSFDLDSRAKDVKKISLRLSANEKEKPTREQEAVVTVPEREERERERERECAVHGRKMRRSEERCIPAAAVEAESEACEDEIRSYSPTRRSWGTGVTVLAEEDKDSESGERSNLDDATSLGGVNFWGIKSSGINVQENNKFSIDDVIREEDSSDVDEFHLISPSVK